jgi:hypothetical protein
VYRTFHEQTQEAFAVLTSHTPRLTANRSGFLARSTALSWPWNKDRILATPGTMPPSFADLALGLVDRTRPVIQVWCKDPMQREHVPVDLAQARVQGTTTQSAAEREALDPRLREDDGGAPARSAADLANDPVQREDDASGTALPVALAQARAQGTTTQSGVEWEAPDPRLREDDGGHCPVAGSAQDPVHRGRTGPLRNGNPRGNPNLAPRCGARTRRTGCPCRAPAMRNGRCRLHGGKSTGPRTDEGRARIRAARTRHGLYSAEGRAFQRNITGLLSRSRQLLRLASQPGPVDAAALRHLLPPGFGKYPLHRETPPPADPAAPSSVSKNPKHRENHTTIPDAATASGVHLRQQDPLHRENLPPITGDPPPAGPAAPIRRPLLLLRPTLHAP